MVLDPASTTAEEGVREIALSHAEARISGELFKNHLVTLGAEFRREDREEGTDKKMDFDNVSVYLQNEFMPLNSLYFVAGVRYDDNSMYGDQLAPRVSVIYDISDNLRLKGSYGQRFRAPSIAELYVESWKRRGKEIYQPNSDLDPEKSASHEAGIEGEYGILKSSLTYFRNELEDMIDAVYVGSTGSGQNKKDYYYM